jgi:mono/diheme cytochrome c family protein
LSTRSATVLAVCLLSLTAAGCRQNMHNQNKLEPYEASAFFADGQGSRPTPAGTVPRNAYGEEIAPYTGLVVTPAPPMQTSQAMTTTAPPVTMELLRRGQQRYNIFCSPCHGRTGDGLGMIVRRGYKQPPSFHDPRLRSAPADHFVTTMTEGFGVMPSYAEEVSLQDRWAIAAYIRALQYSQNAHLADIPADRRQAVESELQGGTGTAGAHTDASTEKP